MNAAGAGSPPFNISGSLAMFDATRLASSIVIMLCLDGFGLGGAAIDICYGKTVCVAYHVAAGKFLGTPRGINLASPSGFRFAPASR
jgi:hypothetical protein